MSEEVKLSAEELDGLIAASSPTGISYIGDYRGLRINVRRWMVRAMAKELLDLRGLATESPEKIATRLIAPASTSALWTYDQVRALLIEAVKAGRKQK